MVLKIKDINEDERRSQEKNDSFYGLKIRKHIFTLSGFKHEDK